jgi:hypothetical protein
LPEPFAFCGGRVDIWSAAGRGIRAGTFRGEAALRFMRPIAAA